jgi:hypothetical protein
MTLEQLEAKVLAFSKESQALLLALPSPNNRKIAVIATVWIIILL